MIPALVLFLFFFIFWYLIYFEKSTGLVFGAFFLLAVFFLISLYGSWKGPKEFGFRLDNLNASLRAALIPIVILFAGSGLISIWFLDSLKFPAFSELPTFFCWGLLQQAVIQGYFFRYFESVLKHRRRLAIGLTALVFGLLHIPNLHLMCATFIGGFYLSWFYSKYRNLFAAGLIHGFISLVLVGVLKPAGFFPNYRVGPEPMGPIRALIRQHQTPSSAVGVMITSDVPSSVEHQFKSNFRALESIDDLIRFLNAKEMVFVVLSERDYARLNTDHPKVVAYVWKSSLIWRRKFPDMKRRTAVAILGLDLRRLHELFRSPMVLISNRPEPAEGS